jgi:hypothetical protein
LSQVATARGGLSRALQNLPWHFPSLKVVCVTGWVGADDGVETGTSCASGALGLAGDFDQAGDEEGVEEGNAVVSRPSGFADASKSGRQPTK